MKQSGVHLSVRPSVSYQRRAAGMLLSAVRAEDVDIQRRAAGAQQQRHLSRGPQHGAQQQMRAVSPLTAEVRG